MGNGTSPQIRPKLITLTCNGFSLIANIRWWTWGPVTALGYGTLEERICNPDCARGSTEKIPTEVELYGDVMTVHGLQFMKIDYTVWQKGYSLPL